MYTASRRTSFEAALTRAQSALFAASVAADDAGDASTVDALADVALLVSQMKERSQAERKPTPQIKGQTSIDSATGSGSAR